MRPSFSRRTLAPMPPNLPLSCWLCNSVCGGSTNIEYGSWNDSIMPAPRRRCGLTGGQLAVELAFGNIQASFSNGACRCRSTASTPVNCGPSIMRQRRPVRSASQSTKTGDTPE